MQIIGQEIAAGIEVEVRLQALVVSEVDKVPAGLMLTLVAKLKVTMKRGIRRIMTLLPKSSSIVFQNTSYFTHSELDFEHQEPLPILQ